MLGAVTLGDLRVQQFELIQMRQTRPISSRSMTDGDPPTWRIESAVN